MIRYLRWFGLVLLALLILGTGAWSALALWYRSGFGDAGRMAIACVAMVLAVAATLGLTTSKRWKGVGAYAAAFVAVLVWWSSIAPSEHRNWTPDVARNLTGTVEGNRLVLTNVRNFTWRSDTDFDERWEQRTYNLDDLQNVDLIMSYWSGEAIAHLIISFGFTDGERLAFSIETRKEVGEAYSPVAGFFKQYELAIIAADESDVVRVRTNVRGEDVRIYHLRMQPADARPLLLDYSETANRLAVNPSFYNTATTNCTTQVFKMVRTIHPGLPLDPRIFLSGYLPDYVYDEGGLTNAMPFDELRTRAKVSAKALQVDGDPDFSRKIRESVPPLSR